MLQAITATVSASAAGKLALFAVKTAIVNITLGGLTFRDEHGETWEAIGASTAETDAP